MEAGKVPNEILDKIVLSKINRFRKDIILRPGIGEDCAAIDFDSYACVLSTDPITGAAKDVGQLAVHISCNDIASCGVEPLGLMVTVLCPVGTTEDELGKVMEQMSVTAAELNVEIIGGHTEVTAAVNKIVISTTCIGKALRNRVISTRGARPGDSVIMTKSAGLEGTAIIARDFEHKLSGKLTKAQLKKAGDLLNSISVVREGVIAGEFGASAMHDITEGGVLGAAWEMAEASETGIVINKDKIPVEDVTAAICDALGLDALKLISSGCMLITCEKGEELCSLLEKNNIRATVIGLITADKKERILASETGGIAAEILPPGADELYRVI
ncbi:hydrogenase expression/formation protein HypE [Ruminiclostridium hungatei]|uniref:Hydrogenase expression/formation protein HypE n=1 Tax=Ruminiclostridium hungatei TaxID=48256 RepID=A0A1V4SIM4_RUMHU|nr:AIR synthase family protein [Ruminiclostridium hungatei]OPX43729.1 hydrogenase expression/formation protein HypE [Ruminiclostridium hungatei]